MKCIVYIVLVLFSFSCSEISLEENPPGILRPGSSTNSKTVLDGMLAGSFSALYSSWTGFDCPYPIVMTAGGEDVGVSADLYKNFEQLNATPDETIINTLWKSLYKSITNANLLIKTIQKKNIEQGIPEEELNRIEGQARFIRALSYFFLVRWFGEIQLITADNQEEFKKVKQSSVSDIYDFIVKDLKISDNLLPESFKDKGRPDKYASKALLSKVYLTMAGWPLEKTENYALARDKAKEVIDSKKYILEKFEDLWKNEKKFTNKEFIFAFYGSIASQGISGSHFHIASKSPSAGGWGDFFIEDRFVNSFTVGDIRKDATVIKDDNNDRYYTKKYLDAGNTVGDNGEGFTVLLRYADVLLIYAESANMTEKKPSLEAYKAINKVRHRAELKNLPKFLSKEDFDKAVLDERNWELAAEMNRWFDLVRRKKVVEVNKEQYIGVSKNDRLLPKPASELIPDILIQNTGY